MAQAAINQSPSGETQQSYELGYECGEVLQILCSVLSSWEFVIDRTFSSDLSSMELSRPRIVECQFQEHLRNLNVLFSVFKREKTQARQP